MVADLLVKYGQRVNEGEVVPFKRAAPTWQKLPKDVLTLANDWFWTDYEGGGLKATMDPKGLGSGLANQQKYLGAQLQQRGWAIDIDDEFENVVLKNRQGQTILLPIEDAQLFRGWAQDTNPVSEQQNDPWGPQGNFAGDKHIDVGGVSIKPIQVGDVVKYLGQKSEVVGISKNRKYARITIASGMGGTTKDVLTSDLQQLGQGMSEGSDDDEVDITSKVDSLGTLMQNLIDKDDREQRDPKYAAKQHAKRQAHLSKMQQRQQGMSEGDMYGDQEVSWEKGGRRAPTGAFRNPAIEQHRKVFKKNGEPVGEVGIDPEASPGNGQWYMKCYAYNIDNSGYDSYEEAVEELKYCLKQGVAEGQENFNGIDISMEIQKDDEYVDDEDYDNQVIYVTASSNGKELGHVLFAFDGEYLMPQDLEVEERYRGQGIAQTMYDYVKSKGYKIRRSGQQTDAGTGFWDKHKPGKNVWEQGVAEGSLEERTGVYRNQTTPSKLLSAADRQGVISVKIQAHDGTQRSFADSNPLAVQKWLGRYGLTLPRNINDKFVYEQDVTEADDPKFVGFMNKAMANKVDAPKADSLAKAPDWYKNAPAMNFDSMPSHKKALQFGLKVLSKLDPETKQQLAAGGEQAIVDYLVDVSERTPGARGTIDFVEEDIWECQDYLSNVFHDPNITSWVDVLKTGLNEVSDATLTSYLTKVDADARKHRADPTKRSAAKRDKSVSGFSRALNKLDARKAQELAPRVGEANLESVVNAQRGGMPLQDVNEARESCPECGGPMFPALILGEKQDACYYKVKSRYKVWPSAYASGALVQCRKKGAANWGNKGK
jgi:hypothetical protein